MKRKNKLLLLMLLSVFFLTCTVSFSQVIRKNGKTFIRDRKGENWDISQAVSIGFRPYNFEFGLGRNAFSPLDDKSLQNNTKRVPARLRILGVKGKNESKAFSLKKLSRHEIANSPIDNVPIAAAYWPLQDLAAVYSRKIDGQSLTLSPSGWTYKRTFVLYDKETGSLWFPDKHGLLGIQGKYFQRRLPKIIYKETVWRKWSQKHPESKILK